MRMSQHSRYPVPVWAHELHAALISVFDCRVNTFKPEQEFVEDFQSPIAPSIFLPGQDPRYVKEKLSYLIPLQDDSSFNEPVLEFVTLQGISTMAWRYDFDEAYRQGGAEAVMALLNRPAFHLEKLRYQAQIADQYEWCPMPADRFWSAWPVGKMEQLRHVCRRRRLHPAENLYNNLFSLYVILCRASFDDAMRRAIVFGIDKELTEGAYVELSNLWGNLEATGQGHLFKSFAKVIRAQVKYLTEGKPV